MIHFIPPNDQLLQNSLAQFDSIKNQDYAYPQSPTLAIMDWPPLIRAAQTAIKRFFCAQNSARHYVGLNGQSKDWPVLVPVGQPVQSGTLIGLLVSGLQPLRDTNMNTLQHISVQNLPVVFWQDQPVISSDSLAAVYKTNVSNIQDNFRKNAERFIEGRHYFKLEGESLKEFKASLTGNFPVSRQTRNLILWTERGTVRHAKMLGTDKAWEVQEALEQNYFSKRDELSGKSEQLTSPPEATQPDCPKFNVPLSTWQPTNRVGATGWLTYPELARVEPQNRPISQLFAMLKREGHDINGAVVEYRSMLNMLEMYHYKLDNLKHMLNGIDQIGYPIQFN